MARTMGRYDDRNELGKKIRRVKYMCKHCEKGIGICNNREELGIELHSGTNHLVAYGLDKNNWDISVKCEINYCPMCGKKLKEDKINV